MNSGIEEVIGGLQDGEFQSCRHGLLQVFVNIIDSSINLRGISTRSLVDDKCHTGLAVYT